MTETSSSRVSIAQLILIPSLITLAVTLLRLVGELQHWPSALFNPAAGGAGSIIGITWLAPIFGIYFAMKLSRSEEAPNPGRVIGYAVLGLVVMIAGGILGFGIKAEFPGKTLVGLVLIAAGALIPLLGWKTLAEVLLAYGYAARIPVAILMYFAMKGNWGTHYDAMPPEFPQDLDFWTKYIRFGLEPQLVSWIGFTTVMGSLFGGIAIALSRRGRTAPQPA